jgi:hypothetical protein
LPTLPNGPVCMRSTSWNLLFPEYMTFLTIMDHFRSSAKSSSSYGPRQWRVAGVGACVAEGKRAGGRRPPAGGCSGAELAHRAHANVGALRAESGP